MKIKVYTYDDPKRWRHHSQFEKINKSIHICATKNLADGIADAYRDKQKGEFHSIFTIREVIDTLLIKWNKPEEQLKQYLALSKVMAESEPTNPLLKEAFRNNIADTLETIRLLTYIGVMPEDLSGLCHTEKEEYFQQIWSEAYEADFSYRSIRRKLQDGWSIANVKAKLVELLEEKNKKNKSDYRLTEGQRIVLHGFYFITPEQQMFLQALAKAGFEVVFFNFYDQRFSETFDFTRAFISEQFNWTDEWAIESNRDILKETIGTNFLSAFEGEKVQKKNHGGNIIKYDSFFEFLNEVIIPSYPIGRKQEDKEDVQIIATNADMLNDILVQYYPERFAENRNFLQYPIGQFISKIHGMLDGKRFILDEDILMSTFSSGWLFNPNNKKNARDFTYILKQLLPFFSGCESTQSWMKRFEELLDHYENVLPHFEEPGDDRIVKSVRSPFTKIAHFSFTKKQVVEVKYFADQLIFIAEELFEAGTEETSISRHFTKLLNIVQNRNPIKNSVLFEDEIEVINELNTKLETIKDDNFFLYDDIGEAINLYLSGKLSKKDNTFIKPFIEVDGEAFKRKVKSFYLTGLDEKGLPLDEFSTPWPLQEETFEKLSLRYEVLELNILRNKSIKQISRYLLFIALEFLDGENMKLELSWMENFLDRKDLHPAMYVHQLGMKILSSQQNREGKHEEIRPNPVNFKEIHSSQIEESRRELSFYDYLVEFNQCQRRFYYSYITNEYPVFADDFVHQFLYTELIRTVKRSTTLKKDEIIQLVGNLFPQWTHYKKESIARKFINGVSSVGHDDVNETVSVSSSRKVVQFPGMSSYERNRLFQETLEKKESLHEMMIESIENDSTNPPASPGKHCKFCPHLDTCMDARLAMDKG
ncbi:hypothetical protein [Rossellomorea aquimaris]|uniref:hypothetical protein n=1 Tax=Rossellomorea aquimaris TaxID=189382 RepID=UPI000A7681F0|nr:hypothetical protein [Rossellomorea aquimaris]